MKRYKITPKGRRALTVLVSAAALVVIFVVSGILWTRTRSQTPALITEPPDVTVTGPENEPPSSETPSATPTPAIGTPGPAAATASAPAASAPSTPIPVPAGSAEPPAPAASSEPLAPSEPSGTASDTRYILLFFEGSAEPDSAAKAAMDEFLVAVPDLNGLMIMCEGNSYGEEPGLAMERARNVRAYLLEKGVLPEQALAISTEKSPASGETADLYRRVELYFLGQNTK